jgi:hypothetical protein
VAPRYAIGPPIARLLTSAVPLPAAFASITLWVQRHRAPFCRASGARRPPHGWLTATARGVDHVATGWTMFVVAMLLVLITIVWKRWRHLFAFLGSVVVLRLIGLALNAAHRRPRPYDVTTIGTWNGYSSPSGTLAIVSIAVIGVIYMVVVPGWPRSIAKIAGGVVIASWPELALYLAVDHPFDDRRRGPQVSPMPLAFATSPPARSFRSSTGKRRTSTSPAVAAMPCGAVEDQLGVIVTECARWASYGSGRSTRFVSVSPVIPRALCSGSSTP